MSGNNPLWRHRPASLHLDSQVSYRLGVPVVYLKGELDHDSAAYLREVIKEETASKPTALILDFTELTYVDSGGLSLLFDVGATFDAPRWLGIVGPNHGVARLLEVTGLTDHENLRVFEDLKAAEQAVSHI